MKNALVMAHIFIANSVQMTTEQKAMRRRVTQKSPHITKQNNHAFAMAFRRTIIITSNNAIISGSN